MDHGRSAREPHGSGGVAAETGQVEPGHGALDTFDFAQDPVKSPVGDHRDSIKGTLEDGLHSVPAVGPHRDQCPCDPVNQGSQLGHDVGHHAGDHCIDLGEVLFDIAHDFIPVGVDHYQKDNQSGKSEEHGISGDGGSDPTHGGFYDAGQTQEAAAYQTKDARNEPKAFPDDGSSTLDVFKGSGQAADKDAEPPQCTDGLAGSQSDCAKGGHGLDGVDHEGLLPVAEPVPPAGEGFYSLGCCHDNGSDDTTEIHECVLHLVHGDFVLFCRS